MHIPIGTKSKTMNGEGQRHNVATLQNGDESDEQSSKKIRSVKGAKLRVRYARLSSFITRIGIREIIGGRI